jgi:hypothetical protein
LTCLWANHHERHQFPAHYGYFECGESGVIAERGTADGRRIQSVYCAAAGHRDTLRRIPASAPVDAANLVQFQSPAKAALEAFPPALTQAASSPSQLASAPDTTAAATAPSLSQQEQLAQLDQVLEQLGINPQSISLDNRLALIKSANDPPALLNLVRTLGALDEAATSGQVSALDANNPSSPAPAGNQTQAPAQNESEAQPPTESTAPLQGSSPLAGLGSESTSQAAAETAEPSTVQASVASNAAAQFQELQAVFQEADSAQNQSGVAASGAIPQPSLSIRV